MQLGSYVAVAVAQANSYSSDATPSLGTCICHRCGHLKKKNKKTGTSVSQKIVTLEDEIHLYKKAIKCYVGP